MIGCFELCASNHCSPDMNYSNPGDVFAFVNWYDCPKVLFSEMFGPVIYDLKTSIEYSPDK